MSRISIDVTPEEHARLKALAALQGKSIKEFVLASTLGLADEDGALEELEALLDSRLKNARAGGLSKRSVDDVIAQVKREFDDRRDA
ncbi:MAG: antitoxin [Planctomycetes bacterium]|nr:antitoxin [Planctomycetota bacterium]